MLGELPGIPSFTRWVGCYLGATPSHRIRNRKGESAVPQLHHLLLDAGP